MKKYMIAVLLILMLAGCGKKASIPGQTIALPTETAAAQAETAATEIAVTEPEVLPTTEPETQPPTEETLPDVYGFTAEEEELLLKLGMAERGNAGCTECIALVMRTVLNRVEAEKFSSTIRGVIYAQDQFTPVMDGSFEKAVPNDRCREALERIRKGWDESQGAFYYEWCEGESWHSQNLQLLFQHCDVRFYK